MHTLLSRLMCVIHVHRYYKNLRVRGLEYLWVQEEPAVGPDKHEGPKKRHTNTGANSRPIPPI